ncbi:hypothetical protein SAMN04488508_1094 [Aquimarina spongiae]|uniref:Uncharacterized protein n=1 Tax=Aquimarina spongiae TaxID=570521 RepID=A0A1M6JDE6_9FLAO|nr:hypothetical protein SAMN04488508_1094 [Aquimarina spongiae]
MTLPHQTRFYHLKREIEGKKTEILYLVGEHDINSHPFEQKRTSLATRVNYCNRHFQFYLIGMG